MTSIDGVCLTVSILTRVLVLLCECKHFPGLIPGSIQGDGWPSNIAGNKRQDRCRKGRAVMMAHAQWRTYTMRSLMIESEKIARARFQKSQNKLETLRRCLYRMCVTLENRWQCEWTEIKWSQDKSRDTLSMFFFFRNLCVKGDKVDFLSQRRKQSLLDTNTK